MTFGQLAVQVIPISILKTDIKIDFKIDSFLKHYKKFILANA